MGNNFVDNGVVSTTGTGLPGTKTDTSNPLTVPSNQGLHAVELNAATGALADLKTVVTRSVSIMSYGADPTGATDCSTALAAACAALSSGGILHLPVGEYRLSANETVPAGITLSFDSSSIHIDSGVVLTINGQIAAPSAQVFAFSSGFSTPPVVFSYTPGDQIPSLSVDAKWFGARGDGVTDDTSALLAAAQAMITLNNSVMQVTSGTPFPIAELLLPAGTYLISSTICIDSYAIRGVGKAALKATANTFPLLRIGSYARVTDLLFIGGLHSIALFGRPPFSTGYLGPLDFGSVPIAISRCEFFYPTGPAIWQDTSPLTTIAAGSNGQTFPFSAVTIDVAATGDIPTLGSSFVVFDNANQAHTATFTGHTTNTFTGCACADTTTATLATGAPVGSPVHLRGAQQVIRVTDFHFSGAHFYWGGSDSLFLVNGHLGFDFTSYQTDTSGFPLGVINSSGDLTIDNVTAFAATSSTPIRGAFIVSRSVSVRRLLTGQVGGIPFIRTRILDAYYQGAAAVAVPLSLGNGATPPNIAVTDSDLSICEAAFWAEIYDGIFPSRLVVENEQVEIPYDFQSTFGVWLDQGISLATARNVFGLNQFVKFDGAFGNHKFTFTQGWDTGTGLAPTLALGVDVTEQLTALILAPTATADNVTLENLLLFQAATFLTGPGIVGGSSGGNDTTTPYAVPIALGAPTASSGSAAFDNTHFLSSGAAGSYTFSFYFKSNFSGVFQIAIGETNNGGQFFKKFASSDQWQRVEFHFYYPGNSTAFLCGISFGAPGEITTWTGGTVYAAGDQVVNGGNCYLCTTGGTAAGSGGPTGTGNQINDNGVKWNYIAPGDTFTPSIAMGLGMINKGTRAAPYVFPGNADSNGRYGWAPSVYYGSAVPTTGAYVVGDIVYMTAPAASGYIGAVCTSAGSPGTWKSFGMISA